MPPKPPCTFVLLRFSPKAAEPTRLIMAEPERPPKVRKRKAVTQWIRSVILQRSLRICSEESEVDMGLMERLARARGEEVAETTVVSVTIPTKLAERLDKVAHEQQMSRSASAAWAIRIGVADLEKVTFGKPAAEELAEALLQGIAAHDQNV